MKKIVTLILVSACAGDPLAPPPPPATPAQQELLLPALRAMAYQAATGATGQAFFDNHIPCVRRGVLTYSDQDAERLLVWHGCHLGPGLAASGSGRLMADGTGSWRWSGRLSINLHDTAVVSVDSFAVAAVDSAVLAQLRDTSGLSLETLPNPGGSPGALTAADLERLANHLLMALGAFQFDETLEAGRGDHTHDLPFGTTVVTIGVNGLPLLQNTWSAASVGGVIVDGDFQMEWGRFDVSGNRLNAMRLDLNGTFSIGGAVPRVELTQLRWQVDGTSGGFPATIQLTLELRGPGGARTYRTSVRVDD